jgi:single-strand DNA-binding protein
MAGYNKMTLIGNLGRDPEVRYSQNGMAVCSFSVAVTEKRKEGEHTEWFRVKTFGKSAENAGQYLQKGRQVYVEGRLELNKYKDKDGVDRTSLDVIANQVVFLGQGGGAGAGANAGGGRPASGGNNAPSEGPPGDGFIDDDMPF